MPPRSRQADIAAAIRRSKSRKFHEKQFKKHWLVKDGRPSDWKFCPDEDDWRRRWEVLCDFTDTAGQRIWDWDHPDPPTWDHDTDLLEELARAGQLTYQEFEILQGTVYEQASTRELADRFEWAPHNVWVHRTRCGALEKLREVLS